MTEQTTPPRQRMITSMIRESFPEAERSRLLNPDIIIPVVGGYSLPLRGVTGRMLSG